MREHNLDVEQHADSDEEQAQQDITKRLDVILDLMPEFGLRDQSAGNEATQRQRQAREFGEPRQSERDQQDVEDEQFMRAPARHQMQPAAQEPMSAREYQRDQDGGLRQRDTKRHAELLRLGRQRRYDDQQRHDREVLEQQDADHSFAVVGVQLPSLGQQFQDDRGRRHRQRAAERERTRG